MTHTVVYIARCIGSTALKLAALTILLAMAIVPPLFVQLAFPVVREWWIEQEGMIEHAALLALIGVLGVIPYLFIKSAETIPRSIVAICSELHAVIRAPWVPVSLSTAVRARAKGLARAIVASWSLMAALVTSATTVMLAGVLVEPSAAHVVIEVRESVLEPGADSATVIETADVYRLHDGAKITFDTSSPWSLAVVSSP